MAKKLQKNVKEFLERYSDLVGNLESESFNINIWQQYHDLNIKSPIEQILYCALKTTAKANFLQDLDLIFIESKNKAELRGFSIKPQHTVGKYRCDFLLTYYTYDNYKKELIVECDSQQFHDRTESEGRYEKARDRYLVSKEYEVFHYTGSEIVQNPLKIAIEIISYVTNQKAEDIEAFLVYETKEQ